MSTLTHIREKKEKKYRQSTARYYPIGSSSIIKYFCTHTHTQTHTQTHTNTHTQTHTHTHTAVIEET